jgi:type II secretory pathway predicted ATPase ExeA
MLPAVERLPEAQRIIDQQGYFVLHAPRQTGKTTLVLELAKELTNSGRFAAVMLSVEVGSAYNDKPEIGERAIVGSWQEQAKAWLPKELYPPEFDTKEHGKLIEKALRDWTRKLSRPLVLFLDEIDSLQDSLLISVLRQLRSGYPSRPHDFPWSLALIGLRDVRDYKVASGGSDRLNTASPFNIKVESLTLGNFTESEVATLYLQHTSETGQTFTDEALHHAFYLTQGQPWLVNALARQAVEFLQTDVSKPITKEVIEQAKQKLIERQDTHLDSLAERLHEERVRAVIEPILSGETLENVPYDDIRFVNDLGLTTQKNGNGLEISNPIYREVIPTVLSSVTRATLPRIAPSWLNEAGSLNADNLLNAFLRFWRQHGQPLLRSVHYHEIAPHIVLMAFLHRVANAGGSLEREYAIGTRRMDVCLRYGDFTLGMELKVWRDGVRDPLEEGLEQLDDYLNGLGLDTGWLVIFDQRSGLPPIAERTTTETAITPQGKTIIVIRG